MSKAVKFLSFCCLIALLITLTSNNFLWGSQQVQQKISSEPVYLTIEEQRWLKSHPSIRVAFDGNFPPYSYIDESGQLAGIAHDTLQLISQKLNIQFETDSRTHWEQIYKAALAREIDVIATMVMRPERENQFSFTSPYIFKSLVIVTHKANKQIKKHSDLSGKAIALVKGYQYSQGILESLKKISPIYVDSIEDALFAVETQQVDATISFFAISSFLQNKHHFNNIQFTAFYDRNSANESIAVRKDWPILTRILQKGLNAISQNEKQAINGQWIPPIELPANDDLMRTIGISSLLLIFSLLIWIGLTKRRSKQAQQDLFSSNNALNKSLLSLEKLMVQRTEQLHDSEQKYHNLTDKLANEFFFYQLDLKGEYTSLSPSIINILGYSVNQFSQHHHSYQTDHLNNAKIDEYTRQCLRGEIIPTYLMEMFDNTGNKHCLKVMQSPVFDANGQCIGLEGIAQDITPLKQSREQLNQLTYYDNLTGLANKRLFTEHVDQIILSDNQQNGCFTLLSVDIDGFKLINDHFGHATGDEALIEVASRLQAQLDDREIAAHIGGDEFVLMLLVVDSNAAIAAAKEILHSLLTPFDINSHQFVLGSSIGIAIYPQDGTKSETLLRKADSAMYNAKNNNIAYALYTPDPDKKTSRKQILEKSLRKALAKNNATELYLVYHSIHCIQDKSIIAYETLVRWQHAELGMISPTEFIPLAIETGLITELNHWIINQSCLQANRWAKEGFTFGKIAINIPTIELVNLELPEKIIHQIDATRAKREWFEIEITESAAITMPDVTSKVIQILLDAGILTSLDKFGAGSSSLANLKNLPASEVKLDPSLIRNIFSSREDQATVHALISSFHTQGKKVIALGVETQEQLQFLADNHCDMAQGYFFSKPATAEEITNYISQIYN